MERDAFAKLLEWKNNKERKPLILKGAGEIIGLN